MKNLGNSRMSERHVPVTFNHSIGISTTNRQMLLKLCLCMERHDFNCQMHYFLISLLSQV